MNDRLLSAPPPMWSRLPACRLTRHWYGLTAGGAHAPRVLCSAPSPNTRTCRRGRRQVQPRRLRSPTLNRYGYRRPAIWAAPCRKNGLTGWLPHISRPALCVDCLRPAPRNCRWLALLILILAGWIPFVSAGRAATFTATLDRNTIALGESAGLTLIFADGTPDEVPALPAVAHLSFQNPEQRSQFSIVNGKSSAQISYRYSVIPDQAGNYTIPPIAVSMEGRKLLSQPLQLKVLPASPAANAELAKKAAFLKLMAQKTEIFLGEALPLDILFYWRQATPKQVPQLAQDGFTVGKLVQQPKIVAQVGG